MANPAILAVDDDQLVLRAVERDLRARYGQDYRVLSADSGTAALDAIRRLQLRGDAVALFLVDQRMPVMTGVEFLSQAHDDLPGRQAGPADRLRRHRGGDPGDQRDPARSVPPQAVGSARGAAVPGPRRSPDGLAGATYRPPFEGVRIVSHRWSPRGARDQGLPGPQPRPLSAGSTVEIEAEAARARRSAGVEARGPPAARLPRRDPSRRTRPTSRSPSASAYGRTPHCPTTT